MTNGDAISDVALEAIQALAPGLDDDRRQQAAHRLILLVRSLLLEELDARGRAADSPQTNPVGVLYNPGDVPWHGFGVPASKTVPCTGSVQDGDGIRCGTCFGCRRTVALWQEDDDN